MVATANPGQRESRALRTIWPPSPRLLRGLGGVFGFLLLVEAVVRLAPFSTSSLPPSSVVIARVAELLTDAGFLVDCLATIYVWILGLVIAAAVAIPLGIILGSLPAVRTATRSLVEFLRPIPPIAMLPLAIVLFGGGAQMKLALVIYGAIWPILFNTIYALSDVDPVAVDTARAFGFGRLAILRRVSLPSAAPFIATGIRVSSSIALILTISAGLLGGGINGIGTFIIRVNTSPGNTDLILAAALLAGALGYAGSALLERGEQRLFRWHFQRNEGHA